MRRRRRAASRCSSSTAPAATANTARIGRTPTASCRSRRSVPTRNGSRACRAVGEFYNRSWFAQEAGGGYKASDGRGYQAPPLDGVWATAPYFHNGSVPTLYNVLNSKSRPKLFTRSYHTGADDYDAVKVGWKVRVLDRVPDGLSVFERRKIYDTTQRGRSNAGHAFGDDLTEAERWAVVEYLKKL